jgi:hypothetical protein
MVEHGSAPPEHHHRDDRRDHAPEQLERQIAFDAGANLTLVRASIPNAQVDDRDRDHEREERGDRQDEEVERIHVA